MARRTTGGTLAAWLIIAAIIGFSGGAFFGLQAEGDRTTPRAQTSSPPSTQANPDEGNDPEQSPTEAAEAYEIELAMAKSKVKAEEDIEFTVKVDPPEAGKILRLERSVEGADWELFSDTVGPYVTNANGEVSSSIWSGRVGENRFRLVDESNDEVVSNIQTVEITE